MKLQQTKDYLLLIDEEAEIKDGDICIDSTGVIFKHENHFPISIGQRKITAYRPLTKEAKELDLPLLPPFEELDFKNIVEDLPEHDALKSMDGTYSSFHYQSEAMIKGYELGYKAAQSKQFSLEEVINIVHQWDNHINIHEEDKGSVKEIEKFIQSLSTQRVPKEFIPEYDLMNEGYDKPEDYPYQECKVLKTTINSSWKIELVGTYKY